MAFADTASTDAFTSKDSATSSRRALPTALKTTLKRLNFFRVKPTGETHQLHKTAELIQTDRRLYMALAAFGLTASSILFSAPAAGFASIPFTLYAFAPVFKRAGHALRKQKKLNDQVLIATRVVASIGVGYTFIASIDALLQSVSQRRFAYSNAAFQQTLPMLTDNNPVKMPIQLKALLTRHNPDYLQQLCEQRGERVAPWMLVSFIATIPLMGFAHAAAFLTTTFGANLRYLGPHTAQGFILEALRRNLLILRLDALHRITRINTLVVDTDLLQTTAWQTRANTILHALEQRNIHIISTDLLTDAFDATTACHIGKQGRSTHPVLESALRIDYCETDTIQFPPRSDLLLLGDDLGHLASLFRLADAYVASQKFNHAAPDRLDVVDIGTTILLHFGLLYSLAFTYAGLLAGTTYSDYTLDQYRRTEKVVNA